MVTRSLPKQQDQFRSLIQIKILRFHPGPVDQILVRVGNYKFVFFTYLLKKNQTQN